MRQTQHERREREIAGQKQVLGLIAAGRPLSSILDVICQLVEDVIANSRCAIVLADARATPRFRVASPSLSPEQRAAVLRRLTQERHPSTNGAHANPGAADHARPDLAARAEEAVAHALGEPVWFSGPIPAGNDAGEIGAVVVVRSGVEGPGDEDRVIVREAAELAALARRRPTAGAPGHDEQSLAPAPYQRMIETAPAISYVQRVGDSISTLYVSPQVASTLGWSPAEFSAHPGHWFALVEPSDQERVRAAVAHAIATGEPLDIKYRVQTRAGDQLWLRDMATMAVEPESGAQLWHGMLIDVTVEQASETRLHSMAFYDSLTGLPNRRLVMDRLRSLLSASEAPRVSLLFLDLDGFKFINDGIGHAAGDEVLVAVSQRLASQVAGHGSLARFGGDEFVIILDEDDGHEVQAIAEAVLGALLQPFHVDGYELKVDVTIGIAAASPELSTPEALLRAADRALYRAKANGRGVFAVYDPYIDRPRQAHQVQEAHLQRALEVGEFEIAYQPVVDIQTRQIQAVEALLRWNHPERGVLRPGDFLSLADETGLIVPLGRWVIEEACRQMKEWQERYPAFRSLQVSVNLSGRQFRQASLAADVAQALRRTGLAPESLALEVKEADALAASAVTAETVRQLSRMGVKVTIDDFGRGWAALDSLTRIAIDDLKLDGSCVSRLGQDRQDDVIRGLVSMARAVGLDVTAGGVENGEQLATLHALGFERAQGQHLAPPMTVEELEQLLRRGAGAARA